MRLEFSEQIFEESSNIKFNQNPSIGSRFISRGQKDGRADVHDDDNSRFSQFVERVQNCQHTCLVKLN